MNKSELIVAMIAKSELSKANTDKALGALIETVAEELANGGKIQIIGFAAWEITKRKARKGINPQTGKKMKIPASKAVKFKAGKNLKGAVNK